ncbi:Uncharacterised protein [uncultured Clostridium sp.]|uniref:hypothetical protein n=1 Tax=uncultured Clostridium sp. TaxID=59620 RepID=UPI000820696B|nr:hypothetical protein [uncultured Clostridium sp.]SCJ52675.1 Uncharacterised protein [uncultured Clostridium sp.]
MKDEQFKKTEKLLYRYFEDEKKVEILKRELELLREQYNSIEKILRTNNFNLLSAADLGSPGFEERVQTSSTGKGVAEKEMLNHVEYLLNTQKTIIKKEFKAKEKIRNIEINNIRLRCNIEMLCEEHKMFIELKYKEKKRMEDIYLLINRSRSNTFELRVKIVEDIARWLNII